MYQVSRKDIWITPTKLLYFPKKSEVIIAVNKLQSSQSTSPVTKQAGFLYCTLLFFLKLKKSMKMSKLPSDNKLFSKFLSALWCTYILGRKNVVSKTLVQAVYKTDKTLKKHIKIFSFLICNLEQKWRFMLKHLKLA